MGHGGAQRTVHLHTVRLIGFRAAALTNVARREKSVKKREQRSFLEKNGRFCGKTVILGAVFMKNIGSKCPTELFCFRRVMIPAKIKGFWFEVSGKRRICLFCLIYNETNTVF